MLTHPTLDQLNQLGLTAMAQALKAQGDDPAARELGFEERLGLLLQSEAAYRETKRYQARLRHAKLRVRADLEDVDYQTPRGLDRALMAKLAAGQWIGESLNLLITGPAGVGKTWIACALAHRACKDGLAVLYARAPRLLEDLALARADGRYPRLIKSIARAKLLILDDWGLTPLSGEQRRDLLEIIDDRCSNGATIIASQIPVAKWHGLIGDPTIADAILDRLIHAAYRIELKGASLRKKAARKKLEA